MNVQTVDPVQAWLKLHQQYISVAALFTFVSGAKFIMENVWINSYKCYALRTMVIMGRILL